MRTFYFPRIMIVIHLFLFCRNHHRNKYGCFYLHPEMLVFINKSVLKAYILKRDILIMALFSMFSSNSK